MGKGLKNEGLLRLIGAGLLCFFIIPEKLIHGHSRAPIMFRSMPPPSYVRIIHHVYSAFFFAAVLFGFAPSEADVSAGFLEVALFILAFMPFLLLETPKEPFERLPFLVFLSPLPIRNCTMCRQ